MSENNRDKRVAYMLNKMEEEQGQAPSDEEIEQVLDLPDEELPYIPGTPIGPEGRLFTCMMCNHSDYYSGVLPVCPNCGDADGMFYEL